QYRKGMTREQAIQLILEGSGTQYDARVVGMFVSRLSEFEAEIEARRAALLPVFTIEPIEQLSEAARRVEPAAGLAEESSVKSPAPSAPDQVKALFDLARAVVGPRRREEILAEFAEKMAKVVPHDSCAITLVAGSGDNVVVHAAGVNAELLRGRRTA